jgi:hypothetical protein
MSTAEDDRQCLDTSEKSKDNELRRENTPVDVIPNGGFGWVCTACCFVINAHTCTNPEI